MSSATVNGLEPPIPGDAPTKPIQNRFALRPMRYSDISILASHQIDAYDPDPVAHFLYPRSDIYRHDTIRAYRHSILGRFVNPKNLSLVAYEISTPNYPIGYGQFVRLNQSTWYYIQQQGFFRWTLLYFLTWVVWAYISIEKRLWPDRSASKEAGQIFAQSGATDGKRYWGDYPERANRWHAQSMIVSPKWQGKGVGRLVMSEGLKQAQEENVIMGLQASPTGEKLYRKLGFEMLGDYSYRVGDGVGGGHMIWYPKSVEDGKSK